MYAELYLRPNCIWMELEENSPKWVKEFQQKLLQPTTNILSPEERKKRSKWYSGAKSRHYILADLQTATMYHLGMDLMDVQPFDLNTPTPGEVGIPDEPAEFTSYKMVEFKSFWLSDSEHYKACLMLISNIHKWGRGERYDGIVDSINKKLDGPRKL